MKKREWSSKKEKKRRNLGGLILLYVTGCLVDIAWCLYLQRVSFTVFIVVSNLRAQITFKIRKISQHSKWPIFPEHPVAHRLNVATSPEPL